MLFSHIFSFFKKGKEENEEEKKEKKQMRERKKTLASTAIMLMLLISIYAEPVSAWSLKDAVSPITSFVSEKLKSAYNWLKEGRHLGTAAGASCFAIAMAGAAKGAAAGSVAPGLGNIAGAVLLGGAAGVACYLGGATIENWLKDKACGIPGIGKYLCETDEQEKATGSFFLQPRNLTYNEYASRVTLLEVFNTTFVNITVLRQAQEKDFLELKARLATDFIPYDLEESQGNVGEFSNVKIVGPDRIFGFSAIPIKFELQPRGNQDVPDPICLTSVKLYAYSQDGRMLWTRTWTWDKDQKCGEETTVWSFETILKGPDPYERDIDKVINGLADGDTIQRIYLGTPADEPYEIVAEVSGYRKIYYKDSSGQWVLDQEVPLHAVWRTSSAYRHLAAGRIILGGFDKGTLPVDMKDDPKASMFVPYMMRGSGAASNIIARAWVNPLHMPDSTSTYKIYVGANGQFFSLINDFPVKILDESRIVVYRITTNGNWELAAALPLSGVANLGDILTNPTTFEGSVFYKSADNVASYRVFVAIKAAVERDDGVQIPIWLLLEPAVTLTPKPTRIVRLDPNYWGVANLTADGEWSVYDAQAARAMVDAIIDGLKKKVQDAEYYIEKGSQTGNSKVVEYAKKAKEHYEEAINYAEKIKSADNVNDVIRYLEIVRDEEMAGDYYLEAARQASYGNYEQAETLAKTGEDVAKAAEQYKPQTFPGIPGVGPFQLGDLLWWLIAIAIAFPILSAFVGKDIARIVLLVFIAFAILDSNLIGGLISLLKAIPDKLKFW
ncbi:hypothetical protein [Thermococcus barophilus]|uniref:Uncharacterized protein n=1 Tax=Thermococcus barophilus TaxID=55802 RepID=A0A0S1XEL8_THEBA|nr:hypothetical protein [Thermococcus barophilus]ALM76209.1 conserved membrane hypothetical protein [Thermococcus barophilus]